MTANIWRLSHPSQPMSVFFTSIKTVVPFRLLRKKIDVGHIWAKKRKESFGPFCEHA